MLFTWLYLCANLLALAIVLYRRYYQFCPVWCGMQALTAWQIYARMHVSVPDKASWIHWWVPGEVLLLAVTAAAVIEALWHSLRDWRGRKWIAGGMTILAAWITSVCVDAPSSGDWYARFLVFRVNLYLMLAILSFATVWFGTFHARKWARVDRMHSGLISGLMIAHVVIVDWLNWQNSGLQWRLFQTVACGGFVLNSYFLNREFSEVQRRRRTVRRPLDVPGYLGLPQISRTGSDARQNEPVAFRAR